MSKTNQMFQVLLLVFPLFLGIRHKMISIQDASADYSQYLFCPYFQFPYVLYSEGLSKC